MAAWRGNNEIYSSVMSSSSYCAGYQSACGNDTFRGIHLHLMTLLKHFQNKLIHSSRSVLHPGQAGSQRIKKNREQKQTGKLREREIATSNSLPRDKEIATLHFTSLSLMSWFSRFCLEVGQPQLLAIHLTRDSFPKRDKLHWRCRNNILNFCLMNLVSVLFQNFAR